MIKKYIARLRNIGVPIVFLSLYIFSLTSPLVPVSNADGNQDQIEIIKSNLTREKQKFEKFDSREKDLLSQVSELEQEVVERRSAIEGLKENIRAKKNEIGKIKNKQAQVEQLLHETEIKAANRLIALYKYARNGYLKILANVVDMPQFWQRVVYLKAVSRQDRIELSKLADQCLRYRTVIADLADQIEKKESEEKKEKTRLAALREDLEKTVIRLMRIHKEKEFYETLVKELQLATKDLKQTFTDIEKKTRHQTTWTSRFAESKKNLPFPLEGKVIRGDKLLGSRNLNLNKGVFIEGSDTEVKAIYPGRVDFSGQLKGYGEIIIINHGSRFFSISAQLSKRLKQEGDVVKSGDVVGLVEKNKTTKKARLYFELTKAEKGLDPLVRLKVN